MKSLRLISLLSFLLTFLGIQELNAQQWANNGTHIFNTNSGNVGIGTGTSFAPTSKLHINNGSTVADIMCESAYSGTANHSVGNLRLKNSTSGDMFNITLRKNGTVDEMLQSCYDASASLWREFIYYNFGTRKYEMRNGVMDAEFKNSGNILFNNTGNVGIHTTSPMAYLDVNYDNNGYARLGLNSITTNYFYHSEDAANGDGQAAIYAYRQQNSWNDGTGYGFYGSNSAIKGHSEYGTYYGFGVSGFIISDYNRCGGILGYAWSEDNYWGSLGYKNSGNTEYGGYFTGHTNGTGKSSQGTHINNGIGAWGDLFGADIHGEIYGIYAEGDNYALYSHGVIYKDNLDVNLQENKNGTSTPLYTNVSTDATVMTSGTAALSGGKASIKFDKAFTDCVSTVEPIVITVTPSESSNGVFVSEVNNVGCSVTENNSGKSNVTINFIAIGKRAGYEKPQLAGEVIDAGYVNKLSRGLHNDSDLQTNGEGLYYENGQLIVGVHPSTRIDPSIHNQTIEERK
jgi:hypothetical protein